MNIEIPNIVNASGLIQVKGIWYAVFWKNGRELRRSLRTTCHTDALLFRDQFYSDLVLDNGATVRQRKTPQEKMKTKPNLYIYKRKPWLFQVAGKITVECNTRKEADEARTAYFAAL